VLKFSAAVDDAVVVVISLVVAVAVVALPD